MPLDEVTAVLDQPWIRAATDRVVRDVLEKDRVCDCGPITRSSDDAQKKPSPGRDA